MDGPTCVSASKILTPSRATTSLLSSANALLQPGTEPQRVLSEQLAPGGRRQPRPIGDLLYALPPRSVAVRPVGREEPEIFAELLNAELDRALPAVDGVEVAALGEHVARKSVQIRHVARRHQIVGVQPIHRQRQPAAAGLDDRDRRRLAAAGDGSAGHPLSDVAEPRAESEPTSARRARRGPLLPRHRQLGALGRVLRSGARRRSLALRDRLAARRHCVAGERTADHRSAGADGDRPAQAARTERAAALSPAEVGRSPTRGATSWREAESGSSTRIRMWARPWTSSSATSAPPSARRSSP